MFSVLELTALEISSYDGENNSAFSTSETAFTRRIIARRL